jgi:hypothetical protein
MTDLNAIRARLGSISDSSMSKLPKAVQTLLKDDLPRLIEVAEAAIACIAESDKFAYQLANGEEALAPVAPYDLEAKVRKLMPPTPEQQIKDIPW